MKLISTIIALFLIFISNSFALTSNVQMGLDIAKIQSKYGGKIGVYSIDRNNMGNAYYQQFFHFPICSVYKFFVVGAVLKNDMKEPGYLNKKIKITKEDVDGIGYSPITSKYIDKYMSIRQLSQATMKSDNAASNILVKDIGGLDKLNLFVSSLGDKKTHINDIEPGINDITLRSNDNMTTPKAVTRDINTLAFKNNILDKKHRLIFKNMLKDNKTGINRIASQVPSNWLVGDKTGTCEYGSTNDVAIIWPKGKKAIILSIFYTQSDKDSDPSDLVIKKVTKLALKNIESRWKA
jgi:beta-lactamase class A